MALKKKTRSRHAFCSLVVEYLEVAKKLLPSGKGEKVEEERMEQMKQKQEENETE